MFFVRGRPRTRRIFIRDEDGAITGFVDRREGIDIRWTKVKQGSDLRLDPKRGSDLRLDFDKRRSDPNVCSRRLPQLPGGANGEA